MKKISALLPLLMLFADVAHAQRVLWSQDFTYQSQQNFSYPWSVYGNTAPWTCDYPYLIGTTCFPYTGNDTKVAGVASYMLPPNTICGQVYKHITDMVLATPVISLAGEQAAAFKYDSYFLKQLKNGKYESATVEVSTDSGNSWTVLKEAPVVPAGGRMVSDYLDLSAYANKRIRLGFRYSDSGAYMNGWMIDNLKAFVPAAKDIALTHAYPEDSMLGYYAIPASITLTGEVMNMGTDTIRSYSILYADGKNPPQVHTVAGVSIPPFTATSFTHTIPYSMTSMGRYKLKVWAALAGDTLNKNDTMSVLLNGAQFMPQKKLVIEEGTGTWHIQGPRGIVYMHALDANDDPPVRISVHAEDPMGHKAYSDYLYYMDQNFLPFFLFDRRGPVHFEEFFAAYDRQKAYFGFTDLRLQPRLTAGKVIVDVAVKPAIDLTGKYRLALVLTEDGVSGSGSTWSQANAWAGGRIGAMGGYESKPNPVPAADMKYDFVARSISPYPEGVISLSTVMSAGKDYTYTLSSGVSPDWNLKRLNAIVLFIRDKDSTILNSKSIALATVDVAEVSVAQMPLTVRPNPANGNATLKLMLGRSEAISVNITDITGRSVYQFPESQLQAGAHELVLNTEAWLPGMYFITVQSKEAKQTLKLNVLH